MSPNAGGGSPVDGVGEVVFRERNRQVLRGAGAIVIPVLPLIYDLTTWHPGRTGVAVIVLIVCTALSAATAQLGTRSLVKRLADADRRSPVRIGSAPRMAASVGITYGLQALVVLIAVPFNVLVIAVAAAWGNALGGSAIEALRIARWERAHAERIYGTFWIWHTGWYAVANTTRPTTEDAPPVD